MSDMRRAIMIFALASLGLASNCVISNLDNAFDSQTPAGLIVNLSLLSSGGSDASASSSSTTSPGPQYWSQQAYLKASNAEFDNHFGTSVSIDGDTIAVGAGREDSNQTTVSHSGSLPTAAGDDDSESRSGAAYVFTRSGNTWSPQAYLKASNAETTDRLGISIGIDGDTIAVSAHGESSNQAGISNICCLPTPASDDDSEATSGAIIVFVRSGTTWSQQAYIKASNTDASDILGLSLAIDGDTIVAGLMEDSNSTTITNHSVFPAPPGTNELANQSGGAIVFVRSGTTWSQQAFIKASNAEALNQFGTSIDVSGDTIVVGATTETSTQTTVTNSSSLPTAAGDDDSGSNVGAAYVFVRSGTTWSQQAYLKAPNAESNDVFGSSVAISGDTIVVGASGEASAITTVSDSSSLPTAAGDDDSAANAGAAYVFTRSGSTWSQEAYLKAPNAESGDMFGESVAIDGDLVVIGASREDSALASVVDSDSASLPTTSSDDDSAADAGAAYVFTRSGTTWTQRAYIKAPNAEAGDWFGSSVAVQGSTVAVGAYLEDSASGSVANSGSLPTPSTDDDSGVWSGAAYVFELQ